MVHELETIAVTIWLRMAVNKRLPLATALDAKIPVLHLGRRRQRRGRAGPHHPGHMPSLAAVRDDRRTSRDWAHPMTIAA